MKAKQNSFLSDSIILLLNRACVIIANIVVMILFAYALPVETYGSFQSIWFQISMYSTIAGLGLSIFLYSYSFEKIKEILYAIEKKNYYVFIFFIGIITCLFVLTSGWTNPTMHPNTWFYLIWAVYFIGFSLSLLFETLLIIAAKNSLVLFSSALYTICYIVAALFYSKQNISLELYIIILGIIISLKCSILFFLTRNAYHGKFVATENSNKLYIQTKKHWLQIGIFDIIQFCFRNIDKLIISYLLSKEIAAGYLNATYEIPIFALLFASIQNSTLLHINKNALSNEKITSLTHHTNKILGLITIAIISVLYCYPATFLSLIFSYKYKGVYILFMIALVKMPAYWFNLNTIFQVKERGDLLNKGLLLDIIITILCMAILYPILDIDGLLIATIIGTYTQTGYNIYHFKKLANSKYLAFLPIKNWLSYILIFAIINTAIYYLLKEININTTANMFIQSGIVGIIMLGMLFNIFKKAATNQSIV